MPNVLIADTCS